MKDLLQQLIDSRPNDVYMEVRYHQREQIDILARNGKLEKTVYDDHTGVGIRVLVDGAFGFASTCSLTKDSLTTTTKEAISAAKNLSRKISEKSNLAPIKPITANFENLGSDPLRNHSIEEKISLIMSTEKLVAQSNELIKGSMVHFREPFNHRIILNSDGSDVEIIDTRPDFFVQAIASEYNKNMAFTSVTGATGGWEICTNNHPEEMALKAVEMSISLLSAPLAKGGKHAIVMKPDVVGFICHEAIGHTVESDFVQAGSVVKDKLDKKVASELVTMIDSGKQRKAAGWLPVDDAGVECKDVKIIEKGILKSFLHSRSTAYEFVVEPAGNERAFEFNLEPLIRMRNTYLEPGDFNEEELLEGIDFGYLLSVPQSGQADSTAEFMFTVNEAYEIRKGEIGKLVRNITLTGDAFEVLSTIDGIGKNWQLNSGSDFCFKWQPIKVDGGGGSVRTKAIVSGE
ncbi:MAG: TldD/PmbA family protein [Candidatus Heimdallarchaeota archaeon]|nr:TldD/PmbA family protein [Candidatus Heimdallarchaeota archaeon]